MGSASELAERCELPEKPKDYQISHLLREYGFKTKSVRKDGTPKYRYVLPKGKLEDIVARYAKAGEDVDVIDKSDESEEAHSEPKASVEEQPGS